MKRKKNNNENNLFEKQQPKKDSVNTDNRTGSVGPFFSGKTYLMLKTLSQIPPDQDIYIINNSPSEQFINSKIKITEISNKIKPLNEYQNAIIGFDDLLGSTNSRDIDEYFIRGRHNNFYICYLSQSSFNLPKRTIQKKSNKFIFFNQTLKDIENIYRDDGGYDMSSDEFKQFCRKTWDEDYKYRCIDRSKKKDRGRYRIYNESKTSYIECTPETRSFD